MSKHTPGPWKLNEPCTDEVVADLGGDDISVARYIRNIHDAHLVEAAPEMWELLKKIAEEDRKPLSTRLHFEVTELLSRLDSD